MAILIAVTDRDTTLLENTLARLLATPTNKIIHYKQPYHPTEIQSIIAWKHPRGFFNQFPNLKWVCSLGAGVDHITSDPSLPKDVLVTRIVDSQLTNSMRKYVGAAVLNIHKNILAHYDCKQERSWNRSLDAEVELHIGVLGLGILGSDIAQFLSQLGFKVYGFSRSAKLVPGVQTLNGQSHKLEAFLAPINCLINLLPLTTETKGILNYSLFQKLGKDAYLINVGRGDHLIEEDLIRAVNEGLIKQAFLDVFQQEPLSKEHPFWDYQQIIVTPHIASITNQERAAQQFAANYLHWKSGGSLQHLVDLNKGY